MSWTICCAGASLPSEPCATGRTVSATGERNMAPPKNEWRVRVFVSDDYVLKIKIDPEKKKEGLKKKRKNIERKFGEGKKWHALGRTRYWGRWRVAIQVFMTFIVINVKRMIKLLEIKGRVLAPI